MTNRKCVCGHLESEHLAGEVTLCAVREYGGGGTLYADFCLSFTPAPNIPKDLAQYPAPNKYTCPTCMHPSDLHGQEGHEDIWICPYCYTQFRERTLNHEH
jgi:hypothetical protein